jgi:hypothetical protein
MILRNEVTEIRKKGTREINASARISWTLLENWGEAMMALRLTFIFNGVRAWARAML